MNLVFEFRGPNAPSTAQEFLRKLPYSINLCQVRITPANSKQGLRVHFTTEKSDFETIRQLAVAHGARESVLAPPQGSEPCPATTASDGTRVVLVSPNVIELYNGADTINMTLPALREALAFAEGKASP